MTKMNIIKRCPSCGSTKITGTISIENGLYIQKIGCKKCSYTNNREVGDAKKQEPKEEE